MVFIWQDYLHATVPRVVPALISFTDPRSLSQAEIHNFNLTSLCDHDVLGFDVPVDDSF